MVLHHEHASCMGSRENCNIIGRFVTVELLMVLELYNQTGSGAEV